MTKKRKRKIPKRRRRPGERNATEPSSSDDPMDIAMWQQGHEIHAVGSGSRPSAGMLEQMSKRFQEEIRSSPMWEQMVEEFGAERAEELLLQFRAEIRR